MSTTKKEFCELEVYIGGDMYLSHKRWGNITALETHLVDEIENATNEECTLRGLSVISTNDNTKEWKYEVMLTYENVSGFNVSIKYRGSIDADGWQILAKL